MTESSDREKLLQKIAAVRELRARQNAAPLIYYKPHPGQIRAHEATKHSRIVLVTCGNRWGKSYSNAAQALANMYGYYIWEVPGLQLNEEGDYPHRNEVPREYWVNRGDGVPMRHPSRGRAITGLGYAEGIGQVMYPKILEFLPPAVRTHPDFKVRLGNGGVPQWMKLPNGSQCFFHSGEQDPMAFEGSDQDWCIVDEPARQAIWGPLWRGLTDHCGTVFISATPIGPSAPWLYDTFIVGDLQDMCVNVQGSIWDNPHLSDEVKREFLRGGGFTDEERAAREHGSWISNAFRAFPQFDTAAHVIPPMSWNELPPGWNVLLACDPAHRRPYAFVWLAFEPKYDGEVIVFDEWPRQHDHSLMRSSDMTITDYAQMIRDTERHKSSIVQVRVLDPRFGKARPRIKGEVHTTIQEDFADEGIFFSCNIEGAEREETGMERIRQLLRWDSDAPLSLMNRPRLRVTSNCINTINALQKSNYVPPAARDPHGLPDKLNEKFKDFRDALRYAIVAPEPFGYGNGDNYLDGPEEDTGHNDWWDI